MSRGFKNRFNPHPVLLGVGCGHRFGPVFDSPHGPQQREPGLRQLEAGFERIDKAAALQYVSTLLILG